ncbi:MULTISPECIES: molybdopterin-dependent oxidoreductase [Pseudanabaena]|uniref:Oxidoreductase molybdopterin binding protein n=2 Tax=Pseudanabaena TaxID=1152 RepID=L8MXH1_9CYAN|nr:MULTISPECIES: molybdopterin-dependent oxidoreductase [Pseudanabaena]ELS30688.1 oxidoreductase molybdopterin binding protein [Pseudanabaena biceps PCC 7429]MDG3497047.1 molybdopterin-dependent oxidoreductase [Pseudanabaena catenata USMAC16]
MPEDPQQLPDLNLDDTDLVPRRRFLTLAGMGLLTIGFGSLAEGLVGSLSEPLNQQVESLIFQPQQPIPEFPISAIEPDKLIVNTFRFTPAIALETYRLIIDGEVNNPLSLNMSDLQKLPFRNMVIRHVCVEGWAAIVQWGGVRVRDLLAIAQPSHQARYAYFYSADGYYESWDLDSVMHPQTLMAYQKNGQPLAKENGAPLRLASPIKLGYKLSKWVTRIQLTKELGEKRGYWEDLGYEWYAGL